MRRGIEGNGAMLDIARSNTRMSGIWFAAWLFTIGFLHLTFWKAVLAIVLWPYYVGVHVSSLAG